MPEGITSVKEVSEGLLQGIQTVTIWMLFYERGANHSIDTSCLVARGNFSQFASNIRKKVISTQERRISMENRKFTAKTKYLWSRKRLFPRSLTEFSRKTVERLLKEGGGKLMSPCKIRWKASRRRNHFSKWADKTRQKLMAFWIVVITVMMNNRIRDRGRFWSL